MKIHLSAHRRKLRNALAVVAVLAAGLSAVPFAHRPARAGSSAPIVGAATSDANGYWLAAADGGVFSGGDAHFYGSAGATPLRAPIVGMAVTRDAGGYWLVASDGGIFTYGDARFYGSTGAMRLNRSIVGMAATPDGAGYWLVAGDGGVFSFGDAHFHGSTGAMRLNQPIVGMAADGTTGGYWMVASDGGIFSFNAPFWGSTGNVRLSQPIVGMAAVPDGGGYRLAAADGGIFDFGDASFFGSLSGQSTPAPVVALADTPSGAGYVLVRRDGSVAGFGDARYRSSAIVPQTVGPVDSHSTSFTFEGRNPDGTPMRFDACTPIHYVANVSEGPIGGLAFIQAAIARVEAATGMTFIYDGASTQFPTLSRPTSGPQYGSGWAPVLIAWEHQGQTDYLPGQANLLGMGGFTGVNINGGVVATTGEVALNADLTLAPGVTIPASWVPGIQHELGHVVGLAHTSDPTQIMAPSFNSQSPTDYSIGDDAGLEQVGVGSPCLSAPSPTANLPLIHIGGPAGFW